MTIHTFNEIEQGTDEWHAMRRGIITASVVGQLITAKTVKVASNDYSRALTASLVAERITGRTEYVHVNADMERGNLSEPIARDKYAETSWPVTQVGFMRLDEPGYSIGYSPDGLVGEHGLIEIKAPRAKTHLTTLLADEVPLGNVAQCQAALFVSGRDWLDFISYHGGMPLFVKRVEPDQAWFNAIRSAAEQFEGTAARMMANYTTAIDGRPMTEYIDFYPELVI